MATTGLTELQSTVIDKIVNIITNKRLQVLNAAVHKTLGQEKISLLLWKTEVSDPVTDQNREPDESNPHMFSLFL